MDIKKYIYALIFIGVLNSCDNYLDELPDNRIVPNTLEKLAKLNTSAYSIADYVFTDQLTDLAGPTGNYPAGIGSVPPNTGSNVITPNDFAAYRWQDIPGLFQSTPTFFWNYSYAAIAHVNEVLNVIDETSGNTRHREAIKGEALLLRAYHHFMLVNIFGMHFDENANINLGVPYITSPETSFQPSYKRKTVKEVYDLVEKDLLEGLKLINDDFFKGSKKYHFTKTAGQAFASRFYLWKKDYAKCITYSNLVLGADASEKIINYDRIQGSTYAQIAQLYSSVDRKSNILMGQVYSLYPIFSQGYRLNADDVRNTTRGLFANPMNSTDKRLSIGLYRGGVTTVILPRINRLFERATLSSQTGTYYHIEQLFKMEEVLLNRAEAYLLDDAKNISKALESLNILATNRLNGGKYSLSDGTRNFFNTNGSDVNTVLAAILSERKKEFWMHGLRWFDIKRHNIVVRHQLPKDEGGDMLVLPKGDLRRALQIPQSAIDNGITANPR